MVLLLGGIIAFGAWTAGVWHYSHAAAVAQYELRQQEAEAEIAARDQTIKDDAVKHVADMQGAFAAGQAKAKTVYVKVAAKGASDVKNYPVFVDRSCDWPAASVQLTSAAFAAIGTTADPLGAVAAVPIAAAVPAVGATGRDLPLGAVPAAPLGPVRENARATDSGAPVPATGGGKSAHPKPQPVR